MQPYEQVEKQLEDWYGGCAVACNSGSAALLLAVQGLGLAKGSRVIVPEFTMVACARAVTLAGLIPVPVDCGMDMLLDPKQVANHMTKDVSAVMAVHIYGRQCNMEELGRVCRRFGVYLIEDMAELHGVKPAGSNAACWSFYRNKVIAGDEGGAVLFSRPAHAATARLARCHGFTAGHNFVHEPGGFNWRLGNSSAQLILQSMAELEDNMRLRTGVVAEYDRLVPGIWHLPKRASCWVYDLRLHHLTDIEPVVTALNQLGIPARCGFKPISRQPEYLRPYEHLNAHTLSKQVLYLPVTPAMRKEEVEIIVGHLISVASRPTTSSATE